MIQLTCTHCQAILTMDDAFAGGVCRCQHCGTIQTVPSHPTTGEYAAPTAAKGQKSAQSTKTLYRSRAAGQPAGSGAGLDDLVNAVAGSGLGGSGLSSHPTSTRKKRISPLFVAVTLILLLLAGIGTAILLNRKPAPAPSSATALSDNADAGVPDTVTLPPSITGPSFQSIPLAGPTVIYLLDRGNATNAVFGDLKSATFRSIRSLGPNRQFQIIFWKNPDHPAAFPAAPAPATPASLDAVRQPVRDIAAYGASDIAPALQKALAENPAEIVIATAKAFQLDDAFTQQVLQIRGDRPAKIHIIAIGRQPAYPPLQHLAQTTGGRLLIISPETLAAERQQR